MIDIQAPDTVAPGATFQSTVTVQNTGTNTWQSVALNPSQPYRLGSQAPQDNVIWGLNRVNLPVTQVLPGAAVTFQFQATAPTTPGSYAFSWKMVQDAVTWFGQTTTKTIAVVSEPSFPNGYANRRLITVPASNVSGPGFLENFPVLVSGTFSYLRSTGNGGKVAHPNGYDIRFETTSGQRLDHEIERWNASTGELVAWVRMPMLSSWSGGALYVYYGNSAVTLPQANAAGVWSDNYGAVWHLAGDPAATAPQATDSSGNGNNGTALGSMTSGNRVTGKIGWATDLDGVDDRFRVLDHASLTAGPKRSWSSWVKIDAWGSATKLYIMELLSDDSGACFSTVWRVGSKGQEPLKSRLGHTVQDSTPHDVESTSNLTLGAWTHLYVTSDGAQTRFYINGVLNSTVAHAFTPNTTCTDNFTIGGNSTAAQSYRAFDGQIDEMRAVPKVVRSAAWIATEYANQNSPTTFISVGTEESSF